MRLPTVRFARILGRLWPLVFASCSTAKTRVPGEVVVLVTSDMAVPEDIDTLTWSVTVVGDEAPFKLDSVDLKGKPLPQTLAIVSDHAATGSVRIALDASRAGTPRVHREALVTLPSDSEVKRLTMPLDWLCTRDANPSLACGAGQTCVAGRCVPSAAEIVPYTPPDAGACFNVGTCFAQVIGVFVANDDPVTGKCVVPNQSFPPDVNVALEVATSQTGNYGVCG